MYKVHLFVLRCKITTFFLYMQINLHFSYLARDYFTIFVQIYSGRLFIYVLKRFISCPNTKTAQSPAKKCENEKMRKCFLRISEKGCTFAADLEKMAYAATIGFFDGVHKGHQYLLGELRRVAAEQGLQSAVLTLDEHPETVLSGHAKPLLTTASEREDLLRQSGVDEIFLFHFDVIQQMTAAEFMRVIRERCGVEVLLMGYDHQFGSDRLTDFADYEALGAETGIKVLPVSEAPDGAVSSSKIRKALLAGDVMRANAMLGYNYMLSGTVVHGNGIGHTIGFPTANIEADACKLIPKSGVYAAEAVYDRNVTMRLPALVNIGTNPTVGNNHQTIETYLLDYQGSDLYGQTLTLHLTRRIRDERKFDSLEELKAQIELDITAAGI